MSALLFWLFFYAIGADLLYPGFISSSWQIKNNGMFAASCIGVAALVVTLEFLRRISKEYDSFIIRQFKQNLNARIAAIPEGSEPAFATFRATPLQQLIRAMLHAVMFGLAYIVMLLAMYYNGYILISIFIGAGIGKFLCDWMVVRVPMVTRGENDHKNDTDVPQEATVCCG